MSDRMKIQVTKITGNIQADLTFGINERGRDDLLTLCLADAHEDREFTGDTINTLDLTRAYLTACHQLESKERIMEWELPF